MYEKIGDSRKRSNLSEVFKELIRSWVSKVEIKLLFINKQDARQNLGFLPIFNLGKKTLRQAFFEPQNVRKLVRTSLGTLKKFFNSFSKTLTFGKYQLGLDDFFLKFGEIKNCSVQFCFSRKWEMIWEKNLKAG